MKVLENYEEDEDVDLDDTVKEKTVIEEAEKRSEENSIVVDTENED